MIPKRPKKNVAYYRSRKYKNELKLKFYKWNHLKVAKVFFNMFDTSFNPYATDWLVKDRTVIMEKRAQAMFDSMYTMLHIRLEQVPKKTKDKAMHKALKAWAKTQHGVDGRNYIVKDNTIIPK